MNRKLLLTLAGAAAGAFMLYGTAQAAPAASGSLDARPTVDPSGVVMAAPLGGIGAQLPACAGVGGWISLRHVLSRPALQSLRDA